MSLLNVPYTMRAANGRKRLRSGFGFGFFDQVLNTTFGTSCGVLVKNSTSTCFVDFSAGNAAFCIGGFQLSTSDSFTNLANLRTQTGTDGSVGLT